MKTKHFRYTNEKIFTDTWWTKKRQHDLYPLFLLLTLAKLNKTNHSLLLIL